MDCRLFSVDREVDAGELAEVSARSLVVGASGFLFSTRGYFFRKHHYDTALTGRAKESGTSCAEN